MNKSFYVFLTAIFFFIISSAPAKVSVVKDGKAESVVVISDNPSQTARYAAEELVKHIKLAAGVTLEIQPESKVTDEKYSRIYIGETAAALRFGINASTLPREAFVMRSVGNDLFIVGKEDNGNPLSEKNQNVGRLF